MAGEEQEQTLSNWVDRKILLIHNRGVYDNPRNPGGYWSWKERIDTLDEEITQKQDIYYHV